jgi:DNA repair photolyase
MRVQGGLQREDWLHWGEFTTFKTNAADLLRRSLRPNHVIYCSPLTDPYQPAEATMRLMPGILEAVIASPPSAFVIQTRGPLILRDLELLRTLGSRTQLRVSFSVTTNRDDVRQIFEPHCAPIVERWRAIQLLTDAGIGTSVALAPILPCDPELLVRLAVACSNGPLVADPFHVRSVKKSGATTRTPAVAICRHHNWAEWLDPAFQNGILKRMTHQAHIMNSRFGHGPAGFGFLIGTDGTPHRAVGAEDC